MGRVFQKYTLFELVMMAVLAALGIAMKSVVKPLAQIVCGPFMIPAGTLAGGLYMMWMIIGYGLIKKPGTALIISIIQALLVIFTGSVTSHGIMSLVTYVMPGLAIELLYLIIRHRGCCLGCCALGGLAANVVGVACVNFVFFKVPDVYLVLVLAIAALSGLIGGVLAWELIKVFDKYHMFQRGKKGKNQWKEES